MTAEESTVFLVDDDPAVLRSLTALVEIVFPKVRAYGSAADFLAAYQPSSPGCLVLDVAMPVLNGLELQRKLMQDKIDLPIVFVTGHGNVQMAVSAMQAGAVNFLEKPFHEQETLGQHPQRIGTGRAQPPPPRTPATRGRAACTPLPGRTRSAGFDTGRKTQQGNRRRTWTQQPNRRGSPRSSNEKNGRTFRRRARAPCHDALIQVVHAPDYPRPIVEHQSEAQARPF